ncbi:MAG: hypothetical protein K9H14_07995 [Actinomycetia bacterium]|nr:hypothetical protein [Actinomycetes bacterium]
MADINNVSKKILEDAEQKKQEILKEAQDKASQVLAEAEKSNQRHLEMAGQEAEQKYKQTYDLEVLKAKSGLEQKLLLSKLELVDGIISRAKQKLTEADKKTYLGFIKKSLDHLNLSQASYIIGSKEKNISKQDLKDMAPSAKLEPAEQEPDFDYGLKLISGNAEYLISPQSTIDSAAEDLKMEIADFLFSKES